MKVTRNNQRLMIRCTDHEYEILKLALERLLPEDLSNTGLRRSWARRTNSGPFLRIDRDRRKS